ncbi:MAG: ATP-binding protein [Candidatus Dormibacteria bacterium]
MEGSGIGLALVRHLVELQGATIEVASRVDPGTTMSIFLPQPSSTTEAAPGLAALRADLGRA